jgi:hypothetical protein
MDTLPTALNCTLTESLAPLELSNTSPPAAPAVVVERTGSKLTSLLVKLVDARETPLYSLPDTDFKEHTPATGVVGQERFRQPLPEVAFVN